MSTLKKIRFFLLFFLVIILVSGCSMPISKNLRQQAVDVTIPMVVADPQKYQGDVVIWGGRIIKTLNLKTGTEVYVLGIPLDYMERPEEEQVTQGRFIAKTADYLDPVLYRHGREVTIAGTVAGVETHPVGEVDYAYPAIETKELHLFTPEATYIYPDYYYWGPWGPYWYDGPFFFEGHGEFGGHGHEGFHEHGEGGGFRGPGGVEGMGHGMPGGGMEHEGHGR